MRANDAMLNLSFGNRPFMALLAMASVSIAVAAQLDGTAVAAETPCSPSASLCLN
jgi:hypothetical protein